MTFDKLANAKLELPRRNLADLSPKLRNTPRRLISVS